MLSQPLWSVIQDTARDLLTARMTVRQSWAWWTTSPSRRWRWWSTVPGATLSSTTMETPSTRTPCWAAGSDEAREKQRTSSRSVSTTPGGSTLSSWSRTTSSPCLPGSSLSLRRRRRDISPRARTHTENPQSWLTFSLCSDLLRV